MDTLPKEMKQIIFQKLPTKSVGLSMCVSKQWLSLIKKRSFLKSYSAANRNISNDGELLIFQQSGEFLSVLFDREGFDLYKQLDIPLQADGGEVLMNGFCRGIFCTINNQGSIMLWNPTIRKILTLPQEVPGLIDRQNPAFRQGAIIYRNPALGFDSLTNDYKVVTYVSGNSSGTILDHVIVFSLNRYSWRIYNSFSPKYDVFEHSLFFNGFIHWVAKINNSYEILTFDVSSEEFRVFKLPESMEKSEMLMLSIYKNSTIGLCKCDFNLSDQDIDIWVMNNYGEVDSWNKIWTITVDINENLRHVYYPVPLGFRKNGELFLQESYDNDAPDPLPPSCEIIYSVDVETAGSERVAVRDFNMHTRVVSYFEESLVLLDNPLAESFVFNLLNL